MDEIHDPDQRPWVSAPLKPSEILEKYKEAVASQKPAVTANEKTMKSIHLQNMVGMKDKERFKELESTMSIDNLTIPEEVMPMQVFVATGPGNYGPGVPKFFTTSITKEAQTKLKTCFLQQKYLENSKFERRFFHKRRRLQRQDNENWWQAQPKPPREIRHKVTDREHLYCVRIYRPVKHIAEIPAASSTVYSQEIWLLGRNKLTELRDMVSCPVDNNIVGNQQVDTLWKAAKRAGDVYQSGYFYINGCFYVDMRCPENIDYSKIIREWAADRKRGLGPFSKKKMEDTCMDDLELRVGFPYLYTHQGNHEHLMVIYDVRLVGAEDPQSLSKYPFVRSVGNQYSRFCMVCQADIATWVTEANERCPENPYFFCTNCYKKFNLTVKGEKECAFNAYKYVDVNSV